MQAGLPADLGGTLLQAAQPHAAAGLLSALSGGSAVLAASLVYFALRGRRSKIWSRGVRAVYTLAAAASAGYLVFLLYWRLLGPPL